MIIRLLAIILALSKHMNIIFGIALVFMLTACEGSLDVNINQNNPGPASTDKNNAPTSLDPQTSSPESFPTSSPTPSVTTTIRCFHRDNFQGVEWTYRVTIFPSGDQSVYCKISNTTDSKEQTYSYLSEQPETQESPCETPYYMWQFSRANDGSIFFYVGPRSDQYRDMLTYYQPQECTTTYSP